MKESAVRPLHHLMNSTGAHAPKSGDDPQWSNSSTFWVMSPQQLPSGGGGDDDTVMIVAIPIANNWTQIPAAIQSASRDHHDLPMSLGPVSQKSDEQQVRATART